MSSSDIKFPPLPLPAPAIFGAEQMTQYARETVRLNQPVAGLRLDGLLISTGSWDVVRAVQAALLHRGVKTETCNLTGATASETSVTFSVDAPYARYAVRNVDIPFSAETVTLHRKGREPVAISVRALCEHVDGKEKTRNMAEAEPFDVKRARAGEPVQKEIE